MKKFLCIILCVSMWFAVLPLTAAAAETPASATPTFVPVLRFVASSDTHIKEENDTGAERITKMMEQAYRFAAQDPAYKQLDAVLIAGDVTNDGTESEFASFQATIDASLKEPTKLLAIAAMNHDGYSMSHRTVRSTIAAITGNDADFHVVIGGYHFIGISVSPHPLTDYDSDQLKWLEAQLVTATAEDADKPVFLMHHEHEKNTVYGSSAFEKWYVSCFGDILSKYPQVVDFSGHSHYPLNHPNSIWQGDYTAIGTGAVAYADYTVEDYHDCSDSATNQTVSSYWIVETDAANRLRLRGMDLLAGKVLCEYILDNPADPTNRAFSPENKARASTPPVFKAGASPIVTAKEGSCTVKAPLADSTDGMPVVLYRAYALDENGKEIARTWTLPWYFVADTSDTIELTLEGLSRGSYTIRVVAETAYGVQSEALETTVTLRAPNAFAAFFTRVGLWIRHALRVLWGLIV